MSSGRVWLATNYSSSPRREILDLQHGAYRQAHHGRHAGRSLRKLPQEIVPERLWCLCAVSASLLVEKPAQVLGKEIVARAKRIPSTVRRSLTPDTDKATHGTITNPDGPHQMNGSTNGGPSADDRVTLGKGA